MRASAGEGGGLSYVEIARPNAPPALPLVLVLHGRGASADDLAPLTTELGDGYRYVLPNGRLRLDFGPWVGYAWYEREAVEAHLPQSRAAVEALLGELWARTGLGPDRTALLGFSQGAALALNVGLHHPTRFAGVIAMSGTLHQDASLAAALPNAREQRVLIVHGTEDAVLPIERGRAARAALEAAGLRPEYHEFAMGHEVSRESLAAVGTFLHQVLPPGG